MKEYSFLAALSALGAVGLDRVAGTGLFKRREFYIFLGVIIFFKLLVNGYLTGKEIVLYNPEFFMGLRMGTIPLEDFLFGFSMVSVTIIFWEYFKTSYKQ